jgi:hypothetical protein
MVTERTALFLILLAAIVEPFLPIGAILLSLEPVVFTQKSLSNWPSLEQQAVGLTVPSFVLPLFPRK